LKNIGDKHEIVTGKVVRGEGSDMTTTSKVCFHFAHLKDHTQGDRDELQSDEKFNETLQNHPSERKLTGLII
jgi:hypothetical protein